MNKQSKYIQVFDNKIINYPTVKAQLSNESVVLVYDKLLAKKMQIHGAVFVDESALSNAIYRYPRDKRICLLQESPIRGMKKYAEQLINNFDLILTFDTELLDIGSQFKSFYYGTSWINYGRPQQQVHFKKSNMCSFIGSIDHNDNHGYSFRKQVAKWALESDGVEAWGKGLNKFDTKDSVITPCYFSIAMENTQQDYYFTEKLIDCFVTDTIPIYWGAPGIGEIFDPRGMLFFSSIEELLEVKQTLSVSLYEKMYPYLQINRQRAFDLALTGHQTLCTRLANQFLAFNTLEKSIKPIFRSKFVAGVRKVIEGK